MTYIHSVLAAGLYMWLMPINCWDAWCDLCYSIAGMYAVTYVHPLPRWRMWNPVLGCMLWPMSNNCLDLLRGDLYPFHASSWVVYVTHAHLLLGCMMWLMSIHCWDVWCDLWPCTAGMHDVTYGHALLGCMMWLMPIQFWDVWCDLWPCTVGMDDVT